MSKQTKLSKLPSFSRSLWWLVGKIVTKKFGVGCGDVKRTRLSKLIDTKVIASGFQDLVSDCRQILALGKEA